MTASQSKYRAWLVHFTAWAVIFGMPLFVTGPDRPLLSGGEYLRFLLIPLSFMVVFYTNYLGLIDRYLTTRRFGRFAGYNVLLIGAVMIGVHCCSATSCPTRGTARRWSGHGRTPCGFSPETPSSTCWSSAPAWPSG